MSYRTVDLCNRCNATVRKLAWTGRRELEGKYLVRHVEPPFWHECEVPA